MTTPCATHTHTATARMLCNQTSQSCHSLPKYLCLRTKNAGCGCRKSSQLICKTDSDLVIMTLNTLHMSCDAWEVHTIAFIKHKHAGLCGHRMTHSCPVLFCMSFGLRCDTNDPILLAFSNGCKYSCTYSCKTPDLITDDQYTFFLTWRPYWKYLCPPACPPVCL